MHGVIWKLFLVGLLVLLMSTVGCASRRVVPDREQPPVAKAPPVQPVAEAQIPEEAVDPLPSPPAPLIDGASEEPHTERVVIEEEVVTRTERRRVYEAPSEPSRPRDSGQPVQASQPGSTTQETATTSPPTPTTPETTTAPTTAHPPIPSPSANTDNAASATGSLPIPPMLAFFTGVGLLVLVLVISIFIPQPIGFQAVTFRTVLALAAGCIAGAIPGFVKIETQVLSAGMLQGGGAIGIFIMVYFVNPGKFSRLARQRKRSSSVGRNIDNK